MQSVTSAAAPFSRTEIMQQYSLTADMYTVLNNAFARYDVDSSGYINVACLRDLCKELGEKMDKEAASEAAAEMATSDNGLLDFGEFMRWYHSQ
jgi:Ca2+-binding EF-hand superfamily protein